MNFPLRPAYLLVNASTTYLRIQSVHAKCAPDLHETVLMTAVLRLNFVDRRQHFSGGTMEPQKHRCVRILRDSEKLA